MADQSFLTYLAQHIPVAEIYPFLAEYYTRLSEGDDLTLDEMITSWTDPGEIKLKTNKTIDMLKAEFGVSEVMARQLQSMTDAEIPRFMNFYRQERAAGNNKPLDKICRTFSRKSKGIKPYDSDDEL